jgi:ribosomal protein L44E
MEHYPKNTVRITKFCPTCNKRTMHRVDNKRVGICIEPHVKGLSKKQERKLKAEQHEVSGDLFEGGQDGRP